MTIPWLKSLRGKRAIFAFTATLGATVLVLPASAANAGPVDALPAQPPGTTQLVSATPDGHAVGGAVPAMSDNGRYVAFLSDGTDLGGAGPAPGASIAQVYVRDLDTGVTTLVSQSPGGEPGNKESEAVRISGDGRFVAFSSLATNLTTGPFHKHVNVFVRDLSTGMTTLLTPRDEGHSGHGRTFLSDISPDGRFVGYTSNASDLVVPDHNRRSDVFVYDQTTGETSLISRDLSGRPAGGESSGPKFSADGTVIVFTSYAHGLVAEKTDGLGDVYSFDTSTGQTTLISRDAKGKPAGRGSRVADVSADGTRVVFTSYSKHMIAGVTSPNTTENVYVYDATDGTTTLVNHRPDGGFVKGENRGVHISADGTLVVFSSNSPLLVDGDGGSFYDVFGYDVATKTISLLSQTPDGDFPAGFSMNPDVSADGQYVAFQSQASDLLPGHGAGTEWNVYVYRMP